MVNKRVPQKHAQTAEKSEGEFDFPLSQQSGSDETQKELMETLEKHYAAALDKKRTLKEQKFLDHAQKQIDQVNEKAAKEVQDAVNDINHIYATFILEYAACEDNIRKTWVEIQQEQEKLLNIIKERVKRDEETVKAASAQHIDGLTKTKRSLAAFEDIIGRLIPQ